MMPMLSESELSQISLLSIDDVVHRFPNCILTAEMEGSKVKISLTLKLF